MPVDPPVAIELAHAAFARQVNAVLDAQWSLQSTCSEWSVGDLVDHVIGGNAFTVEILTGAHAAPAWEAARRVAEAGTARRSDAYLETAEEMLSLIRAADEPTRTYHHISGDVSLAVLVSLRTNDIALHAWDLAMSVAADPELDPALVEFVWEGMSSHAAALAAGGHFGAGASGELGEEAPILDKLLDLTGRRKP